MIEKMPAFLSDAQLKYELEKCESCEEKPCMDACPAGCSPKDFILASKVGLPSDFRRAAARILTANPLGGICGAVCPETHCMSACVYAGMNRPVNIPAVQASLIDRAKRMQVMPRFRKADPRREKIAIIGAGPAGLAAGALLARLGYTIDIFEEKDEPGGMCLYIPVERLPREIITSDIDYLLSMGNISLKTGVKVSDPLELLDRGYHAAGVCTGLDCPFRLEIENEELAVPGLLYLENPRKHPMSGRVAVAGGGATAIDCAITAVSRGASGVELLALETLQEMPLTSKERRSLLEYGIEVTGRTRMAGIFRDGDRIKGVKTRHVVLCDGSGFSPDNISDCPGTEIVRNDFDHVLVAIGAKSQFERVNHPLVYYGGDMVNGPTTVVEAVASGKTVAERIHAFLTGQKAEVTENPLKNSCILHGYKPFPVSLETDFFGRWIRSPFLLSAAPPTDGLEQMIRAYEAGWAGGIMKTAFDGIPIHIPGRYMHLFNRYTYGNCDNVSGHSLDRVCREVETLIRLYPDRLTMASTGGPVTGNDTGDRHAWQHNTEKLESAGVMGIEYSLSCPQGGEGAEGDIASQNASLTAKIVEWVMEVSNPRIPKIFKLTGAVTSVVSIVRAIKSVLDKYPDRCAGITLANTFPVMTFSHSCTDRWEEGIIVGMSGESITPISYFTLARAAAVGVPISGNGGPMNYKAAADFLALGAKTVQFCTLVMKYGYSIIDHIEEGVSHLMLDRGIGSMEELIGRALPDPITDFNALSPEKPVSDVDDDLCLSCGNCTHCSYLAIHLDEEKHPVTDPAKCIGCGICAMNCFAGALFLRKRTDEEAEALVEE
jgi:NADPH-dependent glutamate synthase beta subunit-like oxidoreductase/dihydroorotate dehydrogenase/ferredoxin